MYYSKNFESLKYKKLTLMYSIFDILNSSLLILYSVTMLTYASVNTFLTFEVLFKEANSADNYVPNKR